MKLVLAVSTVVLALACTATAQAATIFSDDFNSDTLGLNYTNFVGGWTVTDGTVDLLGTGFFDFYPGNGNYVDLDGSTGNAGVLSKSLSLTGGVTYIASFELGGSTRGDTNVVNVVFGSALSTYTLASSDPLATQTFAFTPSSGGVYTLSFANEGGDNLGAILDNVVVSTTTTAMPEPATLALLGVSLAGLGFSRRKQ